MKVAIAGAGPGGVYLYRLLKQRRPNLIVDIFDEMHDTSCGVKPCGWAVPREQFVNLCRYAQIDAGKYVNYEYSSIQVFGTSVRASTLVIDKPRFLFDPR